MKEMRNNKASRNQESSEESSDGATDANGQPEVKFECEVCLTSFHPAHVPLPKCSKGSGQPTSLHDIKFLCPNCLRSRRPRIELILSLLMNYEKLSVKLPEGEALTYLTDRALAWQSRAEKALRMDEVFKELNKISNAQEENSQSSKKKAKNDDTTEDETETESESETSGGQPKLTVAKKIPEVKFSNKIQSQLEELMLEGDILEVTMDENQQIWKLLQVSFLNACVLNVF